VTDLPELILFDLDGTLTDSAEVRWPVSGTRWTEGALVPDGDLASRIVGPPMHITMADLVGDRADDAMTAYRADYARGWR
jgi:phosphoglycolate phosphatase-like HAD superfamily hydrolase